MLGHGSSTFDAGEGNGSTAVGVFLLEDDCVSHQTLVLSVPSSKQTQRNRDVPFPTSMCPK